VAHRPNLYQRVQRGEFQFLSGRELAEEISYDGIFWGRAFAEATASSRSVAVQATAILSCPEIRLRCPKVAGRLDA
jgi:hypothetical protein